MSPRFCTLFVSSFVLVGCFHDSMPMLSGSDTDSVVPTSSTAGTTSSTSMSAALDMGAGSAFTCPEDPALTACYLFEHGPEQLVDGTAHGWDGTMEQVHMVEGFRGMGVATHTDSKIRVTDPSGLASGASWTLMTWVRFDGVAGSLIGLLDRDTDFTLIITGSGAPRCIVNGGSVDASDSLPLGEWVHLACIKGLGLLALLVNGKLAGLTPFLTPEPPAEAPLIIANKSPSSSSQALIGVLDEILLWQRNLSLEEVCFYAGLPC